jgi:hypothetical protein
MHFFGWCTLDRFLDRAREQWSVEQAEIRSVVLSKTTLPTSPKILVLGPRWSQPSQQSCFHTKSRTSLAETTIQCAKSCTVIGADRQMQCVAGA